MHLVNLKKKNPKIQGLFPLCQIMEEQLLIHLLTRLSLVCVDEFSPQCSALTKFSLEGSR